MSGRTKIGNRGFVTIPLSERMFNLLNSVSFAKTRVPKGNHTDTHKHRFFSAYLVKNMDALWTDNGDVKMPLRALVIVLPFVNHTWSNKLGPTDDCFVSDLSPAHGKHLLYQ